MKKRVILICSTVMMGLGYAQDSDPSELKLDDNEAKEDEVNLGSDVDTEAALRQAGVDGIPVIPAEKQQVEEMHFPESVIKLSPQERKEIAALMRKAAGYVSGIRLLEAMEALNEVETYTKEYYRTYNLRGAIYTKLRDFSKARTNFKKVLELQPGAQEAEFNLAELDFVEKKWEKAFKAFSALRSDDMRKGDKNIIDYKLFLCKLMQSKSKGDAFYQAALEIQKNFNFLDDQAGYYFANAALAIKEDDRTEANRWMNSADKIYGRRRTAPYRDAFIELGWLDPL